MDVNTMKPFIKTAWEKAGFEDATDIQNAAVPVILAGRDVLAESPTGTGKTLAYLLPLLNKIDAEKKHIQAVILASSHELVMQILQELQKWSEGSGIASASFIGGANMKRQLDKLKKRPQVVVGTPGRISELIKNKKLKMHEVKTIVLDEADSLLVPEHSNTVKGIIKSTLNDRQLLLFSATLPEKTHSEALQLMKDPEVITVERKEADRGNVEHIYFVAEARDKIVILDKLIKTQNMKALAFIKDIGELSVLSSKLEYKGLENGVLHSESKKADREAALRNFRSGKSNLLLASDVAARGLDIQGLENVIHYDLAKDTDQYVHRSGRTGRQGAKGRVISIVTEREERELKKLAKELGITVHKKQMYKAEIVDAQ
ncbi:DEAD/DEAH box helicase [Bacillus lacus]|uniref:DEAD/DEAH box helicase n=1 Tax=Metabacillus lacus TaxID=1983721 RepID=A0A7X2IZG9_9BACI|nr:DEAD/DEAH box helicase [Metabacillus lacus]MRX72444.1 DEAD/DEAH box helicase [Metabacillus lacus]